MTKEPWLRGLPLACALLLPPAARAGEVKPVDDDPLLRALVTEVERTSHELAGKGDAPLYYASYRVQDGTFVRLHASYGALDSAPAAEDPLSGRMRLLDVSTRVGTAKLDNTHKLRGGEFDFDFPDFDMGTAMLPVEDDPGALRLGIWRATDRAYKQAVQHYIRVRTNKAVKVAEADDADDFSSAPPAVHLGPRAEFKLDRAAWGARLARTSAVFKAHPNVIHSSVGLDGGVWNRYFVDSDGSRVREAQSLVRITLSATAKADDGMEVDLYRDFAAVQPEQLPDEAALAKAAEELATRLEALRTAPVVDPFSGPAIVTNRAAAVFFHEIFGHRIEGHRQKDADEGHTFTNKVGKEVVPPFITVIDDPTRAKFGDVWLNGHYAFDDEGVAAQPVTLVERGVLKGFLMGRSPIRHFPASNGHGRAQAGMAPVARQGNLIVSSGKPVPYAELRRMLIEEVKKQQKPYGLVFDEISGGFTTTRAGQIPQAFKVLPLVVHRVYPDGRPDELVRGVDVIGTPLQSFAKILATGNDDAVFNGYCGAESGWVPVSAVAPSLLVGELEVERRRPSQDRPPLLPPPLHPEAAWPKPTAGMLAPAAPVDEGDAP